MQTLPDYLRTGLDIVSVGLNPSLPSVRAGFYFANPRNRFWRALNSSGLVNAPLEPGIAAMTVLYREYGIGFTDVVKRPTAGGGELRAADYREWAPRLQQKLLRYQPAIVWFHGKQAFRNYLTYGPGLRFAGDWGEQAIRVGAAAIFVTPNPSPANAVFSLEVLTAWYRRLSEFREAVAARA